MEKTKEKPFAKSLQGKEIDWAWMFYRELGYRITDNEDDKMILNSFMNSLIKSKIEEAKKEFLKTINKIYKSVKYLNIKPESMYYKNKLLVYLKEQMEFEKKEKKL